MPLRRLRAVLAAAVVVPLLVAPLAAQGASAPLTCPGVAQTGLWQRLPVEDFRGVPSVRTGADVTAYALDAARPQRLLATNGNTIKASGSHGCTWRDVLVLGAAPTDAVPLSGTTSTIVALAHLPGGRALAAVREGTAAASRPHVVSSDSGDAGSWRESSDGLPAQGSPRLLAAGGDGRTAYLTLSPATDAGGSGGTLPAVPGVGSEQAGPAGLLYATTDGGRSWQLRTTATALPTGASGFDALAVDARDPDLLYGVSGGRLVVSRDGGRTLAVADTAPGVTAVEPMEPGEVAVLTGGGQLLHSRDAGRTFTGRPAPAGASSAAYRLADSSLVVEAEGQLYRVDARARNGVQLLDAGVPVTPRTAEGDRAEGGSFHARSGNLLLRYVDPLPPRTAPLPPPVGDLQAPPPPAGAILPPSRAVRLPVGESRVVDFVLSQPESPTPLDLFFLVDDSPSSKSLIEDVKENLKAITRAIEADGADLHVGLATVGPGPRPGQPPYPEVMPSRPDYRKPDLYRLVGDGPTGPELQAAFDSLRPKSAPQDPPWSTPAEGHLIALRQLVVGDGLETEGSRSVAPTYLVEPGQQAGFRESPGVRRIVVHATDEAFDEPYGTPMRGGEPDYELVGRVLDGARVEHVGLATREAAASVADLSRMSTLTGTLVPPGGIDCGEANLKRAGQPLVCDTASNFSGVITELVQTLADRQSITLTPRAQSPVLGALSAGRLRDLDVTVRNEVPFSVRVSCVDVSAGSYRADLDAVLRGTRVASARVDVTCTPLAAAAAVPPPRPPAPQAQEPPPPAQGQPVAQAPAPPAPAPPVVQPQAQAQAQTQTQTQAQVQPLTAAALQQQQELQLALALQGTLPADGVPERTELAMVDRRRGEELRALALLSLSMAATSALGLARLRARREPSTRVRRAS